MGNNVSNALGTQLQFKKHPEAVYEKRLTNTENHSGIAAANMQSSGMRLAQALGVLGDQVNSFMVQQEEDRKKVGIADAERLLQSTSEEDLRTKTALDLMAIDGKVPTAANPYAVALIEKMRGKYISSRARMAYETDVRQSEERPKTAREDVARYNEYVQKHEQEGLTLTSDPDAFKAGFWDNHTVDQIKVADNWVKEESVAKDVLRKGTTAASLREGADEWERMDVNSIGERWNKAFGTARLSNAQIPELVAQAQAIAEDFAQKTGDYQKLADLLNLVELGPDTEDPSKKIKAITMVDTERLKKMAEVRAGHIFGERIQNDLKALQKMTPAEMNQQYDEWMKEDPRHFNVMLPFRDRLLRAHEAAEGKRLEAKIRKQAEADARSRAFTALSAQYQAYRAGNPEDMSGNPIATSISNLPKIKYYTLDAHGEYVEKEYTLTTEDMNEFMKSEAQSIANDNSLTPAQKDQELLKHLAYPVAGAYRDAYRLAVKTQLENLTVDRMTGDTEVASALRYYQANPEAAKDVFGENATTELAALSIGSNTLGSPDAAASLFAQARDKLYNNPEARKDILQKTSEALTDTTLNGFTGVSGEEIKLDLTIESNRDTAQAIHELTSLLIANGYSPKTAAEQARGEVKRSTFVYRDTAVPRSIFRFNTDSEAYRGEIGKRVLDGFVDAFVADSFLQNKDFVTVDFDTERNVFVISGGYGFKSYSIDQIVKKGNELIAQDAAASQGRNITLQEVQRDLATSEFMEDWQKGL